MEELKIIKRDGRIVDFDENKVFSAVSNASDSMKTNKNKLSKAAIKKLAIEIADEYKALGKLKTVEWIQDTIEKKLVEMNKYALAKHYITYRYLHEMARDDYEELMTSVEEKLRGSNIQNQNANVDENSFGGRMGEMSGLVSKRYALDYLMSEMARDNHLNNMIYTHK